MDFRAKRRVHARQRPCGSRRKYYLVAPRPGQPARLRLDGYPWAQYGLVKARVSSVASEVRDGLVRVELGIEPEVPAGIVLEHGLPGELEVEVETASPAMLVLRSVGKLVEGS